MYLQICTREHIHEYLCMYTYTHKMFTRMEIDDNLHLRKHVIYLCLHAHINIFNTHIHINVYKHHVQTWKNCIYTPGHT